MPPGALRVGRQLACGLGLGRLPGLGACDRLTEARVVGSLALEGMVRGGGRLHVSVRSAGCGSAASHVAERPREVAVTRKLKARVWSFEYGGVDHPIQ